MPQILHPFGEEVAAHCRRVAALARRVAASAGNYSVPDVLESCKAFDEAMEFAAFDRVSMADAIAEFYREVAPAFPNEIREALIRATAPAAGVALPDSLPVMPKAAIQLMRTSDETASPAQLHRIVSSDPVLCGRLLQVANSARFGAREPVLCVVDAAARLGVPLARKVLLAACFAPLFASKPLQDLWKHSQTVAEAASEAARRVSFDPDLAYAAGLLHDIGRLVLKTGSAASRSKILEWLDDGLPLVYAETLTYGKDHAQVGGDLLRAWNLPGEIVSAVENHHRPEETDSVLPSLLFIAEEWCRRDTNTDSECLNTNMRLAFAERRSGVALDMLTQPEMYAELTVLTG